MIAPPQCPEPPQCVEDNRLAVSWWNFAANHKKEYADELLKMRQEHRRNCPVCKQRMAYFFKMMEK